MCFGGESFVYADKNVFMRERLTKFLCDNYDNFHTQPHSINRALAVSLYGDLRSLFIEQSPSTVTLRGVSILIH